MKKMILIITLLAIVAIVLISGCNQPKSNIDTIPQGEVINNVDIKNYKFIPDFITIKKGDSVTWTNSDNVVHTVKSVTGEIDSGIIAPGKEYKYEFNISGPYEYYCSVHSTMPHGKITVAE